LLNISVCGYCHIYQCTCFLFFVFDYYIITIVIIIIIITFIITEIKFPYISFSQCATTLLCSMQIQRIVLKQVSLKSSFSIFDAVLHTAYCLATSGMPHTTLWIQFITLICTASGKMYFLCFIMLSDSTVTAAVC
jgi:hypothetical protein